MSTVNHISFFAQSRELRSAGIWVSISIQSSNDFSIMHGAWSVSFESDISDCVEIFDKQKLYNLYIKQFKYSSVKWFYSEYFYGINFGRRVVIILLLLHKLMFPINSVSHHPRSINHFISYSADLLPIFPTHFLNFPFNFTNQLLPCCRVT